MRTTSNLSQKMARRAWQTVKLFALSAILKKGLKKMPIYPNIAGRDWQQAGLEVWDAKLKSTDQDMFVYACPGAGKTRCSLAAIKHALAV